MSYLQKIKHLLILLLLL